MTNSSTEDAIRAWFLADSDRRDRELAARLSAWTEGRQAAELELEGAYEAGYADALLTVKRGHHDTLRAAQNLRDWAETEETIETTRWELRGQPRTRETFAQPHPGDYTGGPVTPW